MAHAYLLSDLYKRRLIELLRAIRRSLGQRVAEGVNFGAAPATVSLRVVRLPEETGATSSDEIKRRQAKVKRQKKFVNRE